MSFLHKADQVGVRAHFSDSVGGGDSAKKLFFATPHPIFGSLGVVSFNEGSVRLKCCYWFLQCLGCPACLFGGSPSREPQTSILDGS